MDPTEGKGTGRGGEGSPPLLAGHFNHCIILYYRDAGSSRWSSQRSHLSEAGQNTRTSTSVHGCATRVRRDRLHITGDLRLSYNSYILSPSVADRFIVVVLPEPFFFVTLPESKRVSAAERVQRRRSGQNASEAAGRCTIISADRRSTAAALS